MSDTTFELDPRLAATTLPFGAENGVQTLLVDDSRWPWFLLVPEVPDAVELDDLGSRGVVAMMDQAARLAVAVRRATSATKTNIATIGNVVPQFHLHVVGRRPGDPNWPAPVWGYGTAERYEPAAAKLLRFRMHHELAKAQS